MIITNLFESPEVGRAVANLNALLKAADAGESAEIIVGHEPVTLDYNETKFLAGQYRSFLKAGRQEEFIQSLQDPIKFDRHMRVLRDLLDRQKNLLSGGSKPVEEDNSMISPVGATGMSTASGNTQPQTPQQKQAAQKTGQQEKQVVAKLARAGAPINQNKVNQAIDRQSQGQQLAPDQNAELAKLANINLSAMIGKQGQTVTDLTKRSIQPTQGMAEDETTHLGGQVKKANGVTRHTAGKDVYGGSDFETDPDNTRVDKTQVGKIERALGIKWDREKKWGGGVKVDEVSNELLGRYKKAAGADASAADKAGNFKRGDKRFSGIVNATKKQFANDVKKHYDSKEQGVAEAATDDPKFQKMMGNIQKTTPDPFGGYVAVSYASEKPSKKIRGATVNGQALPATTDDPGRLMKDLKFTSDRIEQQLMAIGKKHGWDLIDPGQGQGYSELYFDTNQEYTTNTQRQLATNIVKTVNEINKFFASMNSSLQATGLPGYQVNVWQGMGANGNTNQIDDINQITNIAKGKSAKSDPGPAIGKMILKYLPGYEAENDELGYDPKDFVDAKQVANIYITKGERAGLQAQHKLDSHVSEMIDELLSDHNGNSLRTIWDLDEQSVAEGRRHQRDMYRPETDRRPDTSNSLATRSIQQAEKPNVTKSADGHPTVKHSHQNKTANTRVEPTITPKTVKRKDSDRPIPSFLQKGVAEGAGKQLSVQQLATISDAALDSAYGYGRSQPGNTFGWQANLKSAAFAKQMIDRGVTDIEAISDAIHKGWNVTAQAFVKNPQMFDDSKTMAPEKLQAKIAQRQKLMTQQYAQLPEDEKEKDRVVARAMLQAIAGGQQGVAEGNLKEFAPNAGGNGGDDYLRTLASAWYNQDLSAIAHEVKKDKNPKKKGMMDRVIDAQEAVEKMLARGVVCGDGKVRKFSIDYNHRFDGVVMTYEDYAEYSDYGDDGEDIDSRTGKPWPNSKYDQIEFTDDQLDEGMMENRSSWDSNMQGWQSREQASMDAQRRSDLERERNVGIEHEDDPRWQAQNRPQSTPVLKGYYFYQVNPDDEYDAKAIGLKQTKSGKWALPVYNTSGRNTMMKKNTADSSFGQGRWWEPKK